MSALQLIRVGDGTIGNSDVARLFGLWEGQSFITALEVVLFEMPANSDEPQPIDRGQLSTLIGATCKNPALGAELGTIQDFDNPRLTLDALSPLVWIEPKPGLSVQPSWSADQALPVASITANLAVSLWDTGVTGTVVEPVDDRPYLDDKEVRACVVRFGKTLRHVEGSPVIVEENGEEKLVGVLFNLFTQDGVTFGYCFPAADIPPVTS